jgi:hypothetical protein
VAETGWPLLATLLYDPIVQTEIVGALAGLAGYEGPDIPSPGVVAEEQLTRTWEEWAVDVTKRGRVARRELVASSRLVIEKGASFANAGESRVVKKLLSEGNDVVLRSEAKSAVQGVKSGRTSDIFLNGERVEIKSIGTVNDVSKQVKDRLSKGTGQGKDVIIEFYESSNATLDEVRRGVIRYFGQSEGNTRQVRVLGNGFDEVIKNKNYKGN